MGEAITLRLTSPQAPERRAAAVMAIEVPDQRREFRTVDVVVLNPLARSHAQRAVREFVSGTSSASHCSRLKPPPAGRLDPDHEEMVIDLLAALAASLLLVEAEELGDLLGFAGDRPDSHHGRGRRVRPQTDAARQSRVGRRRAPRSRS